MRKHLKRSILTLALILSLSMGLSVCAHAAKVKYAAMEDNYVAVLMDDGSLWAWGRLLMCTLTGDGVSGSHGGSYANGIGAKKPTKILTDVAHIAVTGSEAAAIKKDGSLWMWGSNECGQLGDGTFTNRKEPKKIMSDVKDVVLANDRCTGIIKKDGSLWVTGWNSEGTLGDGTVRTLRNEPIKILDDVIQLSWGMDHSMAVTADGSLWTWGHNSNGELGSGSADNYENHLSPVRVMEDVRQAYAGEWFSACVKKDGTLWTWGDNQFGQLGDGSTDSRTTPKKIMSGVKKICEDPDLLRLDMMVLKEDGSLWTWGRCEGDVSKAGAVQNSSKPRKIISDVSDAVHYSDQNIAVKKDNTLWHWKSGFYKDQRTPNRIMTNVRTACTNRGSIIIVKKDGTLWGLGQNSWNILSTDLSDMQACSEAIRIPVNITKISNTMIQLAGNAYVYTGKAITPSVTVKYQGTKLKKGKDYTVTYSKNKAVGTASVTVKGIGDYSGSTKLTFKIKEDRSLPKKGSTFVVGNLQYKVTKSDKKKGTVTLVKLTDNASSVTVPATVKKNGYTFKVTAVSSKAFSQKKKLKKLVLGENISEIGTKALSGAASLKTLTIRSKVLKSVGKNALSGISRKAVIRVPAGKLKAYQKLLKKKGQKSTVKITKI